MAYTTITKSTDYFNTKLYTGNGGTQSITGVGHAPDFVWQKSRSNAEGHGLFDVLRGVTKRIQSNNYNAESSVAGSLESFDSDGFTVGNDVGANGNGQTFVSWNWKAGTTSGIATDGTTTITPTGYSFNQTSGFSIIKYTGNGVDGAYLPHGLGKTPKVMIVKRLVDTGWDWYVYHASIGNQKYIQLNTANAISSTNGMWGSYTPTTVNMKMSNDAQIGASGKDYIMYCFADVQGFSKIGSYIGNGEASDNTFIYCGFKPKYILHKAVDAAENWLLWDSPRNTAVNSNGNPTHVIFEPNGSGGENNTTARSIDLVSNGFKIRGNNANFGGSGANYVFMAFADEPLVSTNGIPATAR
jgi:hypothetical protein